MLGAPRSLWWIHAQSRLRTSISRFSTMDFSSWYLGSAIWCHEQRVNHWMANWSALVCVCVHVRILMISMISAVLHAKAVYACAWFLLLVVLSAASPPPGDHGTPSVCCADPGWSWPSWHTIISQRTAKEKNAWCLISSIYIYLVTWIKFQTASHLRYGSAKNLNMLWTDWEEPTRPIPNRTWQPSNVNKVCLVCLKGLTWRKPTTSQCCIQQVHASAMKFNMSCHKIPNRITRKCHDPMPCDTLWCDCGSTVGILSSLSFLNLFFSKLLTLLATNTFSGVRGSPTYIPRFVITCYLSYVSY